MKGSMLSPTIVDLLVCHKEFVQVVKNIYLHHKNIISRILPMKYDR